MKVDVLVTRDIARAPLKPRTRAMRRSTWRVHGEPHIGGIACDALTPAIAAEWYAGRSAVRPHAAAQALAMLSAAWGRAARRGEVPGVNPCASVRRRRLPGRERFLSAAEYARLGAALDAVEERYAAAAECLRLVALTGCRESEIRGLVWREVDLDAGLLRLRDSKTGPRLVWLSSSARAVLETRPRSAPFWFVFRGARGGRLSAETMYRTWRAVREAANLPGLRIHDLRHSFASAALECEVPLGTLQRLMGHGDIKTTMRYVHQSPDLARAAVRSVAEIVA